MVACYTLNCLMVFHSSLLIPPFMLAMVWFSRPKSLVAIRVSRTLALLRKWGILGFYFNMLHSQCVILHFADGNHATLMQAAPSFAKTGTPENSSENQDQPSPISVLEASFEDLNIQSKHIKTGGWGKLNNFLISKSLSNFLIGKSSIIMIHGACLIQLSLQQD